MNLAVFDLDHTLLAADSDYLWGQYMVEHGLVDRDYYQRENERFYAQYQAGTLDIHEFARFALKPLTLHALPKLHDLRRRFVAEVIAPVVAKHTPALIEKHRRAGDELIITTATNRFIVEPIAEHLGIPHLIATDPEVRNGVYTGEIARPNFQAGKVDNLREWIAAHPRRFERLIGYSDSRNDIPLLAFMDQAHAVDPDPVLRAEAEQRGWPVISLRE